MTNSTITGNTVSGGSTTSVPSNAGGIYNLGANAAEAVQAGVTLTNTILAHTSSSLPDLYDAAPAKIGQITNSAGTTATTDASAADIVTTKDGSDTGITGSPSSADPKLGPLQNNGGPGMATELPAAGSPTLNHGVTAGAPATDERGVTRPQGSAPDIGAVEYSLPLNLTLPRVSGVLHVGSRLTCVNASWHTPEGPTAFTYRWRDNGALISDATHATFVPGAHQSGHLISCAVTATNPAGGTTVTSRAVRVIGPPKCTLRASSDTVPLNKTGPGTQPGTLTFTIRCDQTARLTLSGKLIEQLGGGSFTTFVVPATRASVLKAVTKRVTLRLPAVKALKQHRTLSGKFILAARSNAGLSGRASVALASIKGRG